MEDKDIINTPRDIRNLALAMEALGATAGAVMGSILACMEMPRGDTDLAYIMRYAVTGSILGFSTGWAFINILHYNLVYSTVYYIKQTSIEAANYIKQASVETAMDLILHHTNIIPINNYLPNKFINHLITNILVDATDYMLSDNLWNTATNYIWGTNEQQPSKEESQIMGTTQPDHSYTDSIA